MTNIHVIFTWNTCPKALKVVKVKGHATDTMVKEGKVKLAEKKGNDRSDTAAALGVTESQAKVHAFGALVSCIVEEVLPTSNALIVL